MYGIFISFHSAFPSRTLTAEGSSGVAIMNVA